MREPRMDHDMDDNLAWISPTDAHKGPKQKRQEKTGQCPTGTDQPGLSDLIPNDQPAFVVDVPESDDEQALGVSAGIAGLICLAGTIVRGLVRYRGHAKQAREEINSLLAELSSLEDILHSLGLSTKCFLGISVAENDK